jgi:hypothetical protein
MPCIGDDIMISVHPDGRHFRCDVCQRVGQSATLMVGIYSPVTGCLCGGCLLTFLGACMDLPPADAFEDVEVQAEGRRRGR